MVVLLIEQVAIGSGAYHVEDAMPGFAVPWGGWMRVMGAALRVLQPVAPVPACAAVLACECARRRNAQPQTVRRGRIKHDGGQGQSGDIGLPAVDRGPFMAVVVADKQGRRVGPGVQPGADTPKGPDRLHAAGAFHGWLRL
jgi:hypothetical protein